jgi:signal transduction histidine kinase
MPKPTMPVTASLAAANRKASELNPHAYRAAALALKETLWQDSAPRYLEQHAEALWLAQQCGDEALYAELLLLGIVPLYRAHRAAEAEVALAEAKATFARLQDESGLAVWRMYSGFSHYVQGDLVQHVALLRKALPELAHHPDMRHRVRALDTLAFTLLDVGLHDAAQEILAQQLVAAQACRPPWERSRKRAVIADLEVRFFKLRRRFGWYVLPAEHPEVQVLLKEIADAQGMYTNEPDGVDKYLALGNYIQYLIHAGIYKQAQSVWMSRSRVWDATSFSPAFTWAREAEVAVFCEHNYAHTIALVQSQLTKLTGIDKAADLDLHAVLAQAHYKSGDYKSAYEAQKQFYERSMQLANNNAQTQAALLGMELKAEREKLQSQQALVHAGKLVAVGQLASSLAHEINQPAATLLLLARQLQGDLEAQRWDELAHGINDVGHLTERLSQLVIRLKNFARDEPVHLQLLSLREVLQQAHSMVQPRLKASGVQYHAEIPAGLYIRADQERLSLALINVINNALDALNGQTNPAPEIRVTVEGHAEAGEVHLHINDNGPGLSEEAQAKLFEPFYTTKPVGQGLGLGMTITREALDSMQARVYACNAPAPHRGVVVTVVLVAARVTTGAGYYMMDTLTSNRLKTLMKSTI